jgi:hypothetical protein
MNEIKKTTTIILSKEEIESPKPIIIELNVQDYEGECVTYTITYPKDNE